MRSALTDDRLLRFLDERLCHRLRVVFFKQVVHAFRRKGVDKPRLSARKRPRMGNGLGFENLPCVPGVLRIEGGDFGLGEVRKAKTLRLHIERACRAKRFRIGAYAGEVVADVAHAHERHGYGERELRIGIDGARGDNAVAQLAQKSDERVVGEAVHFVEKHDERPV